LTPPADDLTPGARSAAALSLMIATRGAPDSSNAVKSASAQQRDAGGWRETLESCGCTRRASAAAITTRPPGGSSGVEIRVIAVGKPSVIAACSTPGTSALRSMSRSSKRVVLRVVVLEQGQINPRGRGRSTS